MPPIFISAVITDGHSVLFEVEPENAALETAPSYSLPRIPFLDDDASIEEALVERLAAMLGVRVVEQEFLDTLYEREQDTDEVKLNNLQLVTAWEGTLPQHSQAGRRVTWVPLVALAEIGLTGDLRAALLTTFGIDAGPFQPELQAAAPGRLIIVTGPAGAGKSTVARLIARALPRAALVEIDVLSHMAVAGRPGPRWNGGDEAASRRYERLALSNAAALGRNFSLSGYDAVIEGVLETPEDLDVLLNESGTEEAYFVTLMPSREELLERDHGRPPDQQMGPRSAELHDVFGFSGEFRGLHLDSSGLSPEETAQCVLELLYEARVR